MASPPRPNVAPMIVVQDVDKNYEYFTNVLGFAGTGRMTGPDGTTMHAGVMLPTKRAEAHLMLSPLAMAKANTDMTGDFGRNLDKGPLGNGVVLYFDVDGVDAYHDFIRKNGALIDEPPTDQFWGDRTISVLTPDGYYLTFAEPIKGFKPGPEMENLRDQRPATAPNLRKGTTRRTPAAKRTTRRTAKAGTRTARTPARTTGRAKGRTAKAKSTRRAGRGRTATRGNRSTKRRR